MDDSFTDDGFQWKKEIHVHNVIIISLAGGKNLTTNSDTVTATPSPVNISQYRSVQLDFAHIEHCLIHSHELRFQTFNGTVRYTRYVSTRGPTSHCDIYLSTLPGMLFRFHVPPRTSSITFDVDLKDCGANGRCQTFWRVLKYAPPPIVYSRSSNILIALRRVSAGSQSVRVELYFDTIPRADGPEVELLFMSNTTGFVQSPLWDKGVAYPPSMDSWVFIPVPPGHQAVLTFRHLSLNSCFYDSVSIYVGGTKDQHRVGKFCAKLPPAQHLSNDTHIRFISGAMSLAKLGFRIQFFFRVWILQRVGSQWNCSVPDFRKDYGKLFPCNFE
ncbi:hypothetical protein ACOMHN_034975 [Nucella lapillus]